MLCRFKQIKCHLENLPLLLDLPGFTTRTAKWEIDEEETGNTAMLDDVPCSADDNRRDTVFFKMPTDQTHGLMTDRSDRYHDHGIEFVALCEVQSLG